MFPSESLASLAVALGNWIGKAFISSNEHWIAFNGQLLEEDAEVVEGVDEEVEAAAKALVATIEKYLGEPIGKYLE